MTHIALIDSGIGGFSVLAEIEAAMPEVAISYFMDNLYLPYGELSEADLLKRLESIVTFLLAQSELDIIVIACNTASTQSLDFLRQRFDHTFVGVVPAIKPAALLSRSGRIGLLATPATVQGAYSHQLIDDFAEHCLVQRVGSSELVHQAETLFWQTQNGENAKEIEAQVRQSIGQIINSLTQVDTIVLGCTHFPLIKAVIQQVLGDGVVLVDSGEAIAKRVCSLLGPLATVDSGQPMSKLLFSTQVLSDDKLNKLTEMGFTQVEHVQL